MKKTFLSLIAFILLVATTNAPAITPTVRPDFLPNLTAGRAVLSEQLREATRAFVAPAAYNRTANITYATLKAALAALNGQTATQNILIEWEGDQACQGANVSTLNMGNFTLTIRVVGWAQDSDGIPLKTNPRPRLDVGGADTAVSFNNSGNNGLGNVRWFGGEITNYNYNSGSCKAISGTAVKGACLIKDVVFTRGAIPIRWVGSGNGTTSQNPCGDLTLEDIVCTHGYGAFRLGLGIATTYRDFGAVIIRRCKTRWDRGYLSGTLSDPGNTPSGHVVCALKNFTSLLIEDCTFDGAGKSIIAIENTGTVTIRRNKLFNDGLLNTAGGAIDVQAKSGYLSTLTVFSNLFVANKTGIMYVDGSNAVAGTGEFYFQQNTIDEDPAANRNIVYLANGVKPLRNMNNIYNLNSTATQTVWNNGVNVAGPASDFLSDGNVWYKPVANRTLMGGSIGGVSVAATTLSALQSQTQNDPSSPNRDSHSTSAKPVFNKDL